MSIRVYPGFDPFYVTPNIKGIYDVFGTPRLRYTCRGFPAFDQKHLAFVVEAPECKVYIDHADDSNLSIEAIEWCDVYGKVNLELSKVPPDYAAKVLPLGPSFPFRFWGSLASAALALRSFALCRARLPSVKEHFANWRRQYKYRHPESAYEPGRSEADYIFFSSTIWKREPQCNLYRSRYVEACRALEGVRFEGGFLPRWRNDVPGYEQYTVTPRPSHREYLRNTKRSAVVFSTPAVKGCHGWKLGEFLAMGKAIVSTPLSREVPAPLAHGEQIHFVDGSPESIQEAVRRICRDADYRRHLENNARAYYLEYLQPRRVIERLLSSARSRLHQTEFLKKQQAQGARLSGIAS
jgi:hypothetical protein